MARLSELFNVNQFIVSQVNLHARVLGAGIALGAGSLAKVIAFLKKELKTVRAAPHCQSRAPPVACHVLPLTLTPPPCSTWSTCRSWPW